MKLLLRRTLVPQEGFELGAAYKAFYILAKTQYTQPVAE